MLCGCKLFFHQKVFEIFEMIRHRYALFLGSHKVLKSLWNFYICSDDGFHGVFELGGVGSLTKDACFFSLRAFRWFCCRRGVDLLEGLRLF